MKASAVGVALLAWAALAPTARGQAALASVSALDRRITVHAKDVALRDALDRVAAAGSFKLSYSGDNLPLDRRVSVWRDTSLVRDVLAELLRPFLVTPVSLPDDQIVLAPRASEVRDTTEATVTVLERVVVTGSAVGAPARALPVALDVVAGREIERRGQTSLSTVFDGSVPGVWMWEQAPTTMLAHYGSIRGASSFGASYPKVYIDGIEVANPLLLTQLMPERVERVEVIRGPQGAALYGSDAISGVVNIISRQDAGVVDGTRMMLRSEYGYSGGLATTAVQQHTVSARVGSSLRSAGGSIGYSTSGAYIPDAYSRELRASGSAKLVGTVASLTANIQYAGKDAGIPVSPLLSGLFRSKRDSQPQSLRSYTAGATLTLVPNDIWTYAITSGLDGYSLANVPTDGGAVSFFVDSALRAAEGSALRATMRASAVARVGTPDRVGATLTFAAERAGLRDLGIRPATFAGQGSPPPPDSGASGVAVVDHSINMGFTQQADLAFHNTAYVSAGIRQERVVVSNGVSQYRVLPMLGGALVKDYSAMTAKVRLAYGKGIRTPASIERAAGPRKHRFANPFLSPEEQSGVEGGVDLLFGSRLGLHLTRFDQLAYGLIQEVLIGTDSSSSGPGSGGWSWTQFQNVGEIANKGWETQASATIGELSFVGALSTVSSRVRQLAVGYTGDLRTGDRMLGVPSRTLTATVAWTRRSFQVSSTLARAADWVNYDRLAIAKCISADADSSGACPDARALAKGTTTGATLRKYWKAYDGNTRLRMSTSFDLRRGLMLMFTGENLLNYQRGEPDSITIVPGRTLTAGIRARF